MTPFSYNKFENHGKAPDLASYRAEFKRRFGDEPRELYFCPGRVNLLGEHLDYNGGPVLPAALNLGTYALVRGREEAGIRLASVNRDKLLEIELSKLTTLSNREDWSDYPRAVLAALVSRGVTLAGADILYASTLPLGSGLSSSAAIEVLTAFLALSRDGGTPPSSAGELEQIALLCQQVENEVLHVRCGIMDQFAVALGRKGHAILLDCNTLAFRYVPLILHGVVLVLLDTRAPRSLAASAYNERRAECESALSILRSDRPLAHLADASPEDIKNLPQPLKKRAQHVVEETRRVEDGTRALESGDSKRFGALLSASHDSLRDLYEVTGHELDAIVAAARRSPFCRGARMTGAGFGGCAIAMVDRDGLEPFLNAAASDYRLQTGRTGAFYPFEVGDGVRRLDADLVD